MVTEYELAQVAKGYEDKAKEYHALYLKNIQTGAGMGETLCSKKLEDAYVGISVLLYDLIEK